MLFSEYLKSFNWYVFIGTDKTFKSKVLINFETDDYIKKGQYFEAISLGDKRYKLGSHGNTRWNRKDIVYIDQEEMLEKFNSEEEIIKRIEMLPGEYSDPEGNGFSDDTYDRLTDIGIVHK